MQNKKLFYGRRQSRPLKDDKKDLVENLLPNITLTEQTLKALQQSDKPLWLEIGFGGGEHLHQQALSQPQTNFIGCEPFINGVASLLGYIHQDALDNVWITQNPIQEVLKDIEDNSLDRCFLLFSDPWTKKRHNKRRVIQHDLIKTVHKKLKPGALWHVATDDPGYQTWMMEHFGQHTSIFKQYRANPAERPAETDWPYTRYEKKALRVGRTPLYWVYEKA